MYIYIKTDKDNELEILLVISAATVPWYAEHAVYYAPTFKKSLPKAVWQSVSTFSHSLACKKTALHAVCLVAVKPQISVHCKGLDNVTICPGGGKRYVKRQHLLSCAYIQVLLRHGLLSAPHHRGRGSEIWPWPHGSQMA